MQQSEKEALAQHVSRRKIVLELLERLITRVRERGEDEEPDYHLESTLHSLICPMRVRGDDPRKLEQSAHDLWVIDERFAFATAFSSDDRLGNLLKGGSEDRPDLLLWDLSHGLGITDRMGGTTEADTSEPIRKMMIVEFKRPGRKKYRGDKDNVHGQVNSYLNQLKNGEIENFKNSSVSVAEDCIFYCYIIADIVGDLKTQLGTWKKTSNGQGRILYLDGDFRGFIEVMQWQDLLNDAWLRNRASLQAGGLDRH